MNDYNIRRMQNVLKVVCRICGMHFFTDKTDSHNKMCEARRLKKLAMKGLNEDIMKMISRALQTRL